mgnify:CR=1 FL=1|tara:strand:- start:7957 stop:9432 length:1476 start_codon:yes stop_codon:yes gene_type:complete
MIKGDKTLDGCDIKTLSVHSHKRIIKICDFCNKEVEISLREIYKSRKRTHHGKDACFKCGQRESGKLRRKGNTLIGDGYFASYNEEGNRILEHRQLIENQLGRPLLEREVIHHIDGNKLNNNIDNLILCDNSSLHRQIHSNLEQISFGLVQNGLIKFNKISKNYYIENSTFEQSLGFENISIKQLKNKAKSRLDVNCTSEIIKGVIRPTPFIAANMSTVINESFYLTLYRLGAFGFMHRADTNENRIASVVRLAKEVEFVATSIGIGQKEEEMAQLLINNGANVLVIDIAHGYSDEVIELGRKLKLTNPHIKMVLGNTVNPDMLDEIADFADGLKVGIAQGFACETKNTAGCTEKQFSAVLKFKERAAKLGIPIISDGGIREPADCVKAIGAGASGIMMGKIFAACPESAGLIVEGQKLYAGMASEHVQTRWKKGLKAGTCAEGGVRMLELSDSIDKVLERYTGALRSGITYSGSLDIKEFQKNVQWIRLT